MKDICNKKIEKAKPIVATVVQHVDQVEEQKAKPKAFNIFDFVTINKLRVIDDLGVDDSHPNFEAHKIVADNIYNSILKDPGYYTTFHSII